MKSIFNGKDYVTTVDDDTANAIMTDIIGKRKSHIEIDGELYKTTYLQVKNGDWKSMSSSDKKIKYDPYDPIDKEKIRGFELEWNAFSNGKNIRFEEFLVDRGAINYYKGYTNYSIKNPELFEDLWALWNRYSYLEWIRERAKRLSNENLNNPEFVDQKTKKEIDPASLFDN